MRDKDDLHVIVIIIINMASYTQCYTIADPGPAGRVAPGACGRGAGGRLAMSSTNGGERDCRGGRLGGTSSENGEGALWWRNRGEVERGEREGPEQRSSVGTGGRGISGGGGRGDVERGEGEEVGGMGGRGISGGWG